MEKPSRSRCSWRWALLVIVALAVPTAVQTLPAPDRLGSRFAPDDGDAVFLMWVMRHETTALTHHPSEVFQGNIYFPHRDTIAWSDNVLAYVPVFAAASALAGGNPVLAFNVVLFLAYLAGALAVYLLACELLRARGSALVAALLFTLAPYRGVAISHAQLAGFFGVALAFLFLVRWCRRRRGLDAVGLGVAAAVTWYTTTYYAVLLAAAMAAFIVTWALRQRGRVGARFWVGLLGAGLVAGVLLAPTIGPYLRLQREEIFERRADEILAPRLASFTEVPPSILYRDVLGRRSRPTDQGRQFPGGVTLALVALGIVATVRRWGPRAEAVGDDSPPDQPERTDMALPFGVAAAVAVAAMVGPAHGLLSIPYDVLRAVVPGFASIRDVGRFWLLPMMVLALAAGWGLTVLERVVAPRRRPVLIVAAGALALLELLHRPLTFASLDRSPEQLAANRVLARLPAGVVTEVPAPLLAGPAYPFVAAPRQYRSLVDGHPRLEGYSGNGPPDFGATQAAVSAFPAPEAVARLRWYGVRYVLVHGGPTPCDGELGPQELARLRAILAGAPDVDRVVDAGRDRVVVLAAGRPATEPAAVAPIHRILPACAAH